METPKIKAEQLLDKYYKLFSVDLENTISEYEAIECAKITVDEILKSVAPIDWGKNEDDIDFSNYFKYWQEVKTELNKL